MSLIEINWNPTQKELRNFGIIALTASIVLSLLLHIFKGLGINWIFIFIGFGFTIFILSLISIKAIRIIYLAMILATSPIGWIISFLLLVVFYFLILTPIGLFFRLIGRDPLHRKFDNDTKSYWLLRQPPDKIDKYFHQF